MSEQYFYYSKSQAKMQADNPVSQGYCFTLEIALSHTQEHFNTCIIDGEEKIYTMCDDNEIKNTNFDDLVLVGKGESYKINGVIQDENKIFNLKKELSDNETSLLLFKMNESNFNKNNNLKSNKKQNPKL